MTLISTPFPGPFGVLANAQATFAGYDSQSF